MLLATLKAHLQGLVGTCIKLDWPTICYNEAIEACLMNEDNRGGM